MKKVLIITYYWPPASGPGVQRWLKFSKYLKDFGWSPIILTVDGGSYVNEDPELLKDIPSDLKVFKTKSLEPFLIYNALRGKRGKSVEVGMGNIKGEPSFFKKVSTYIRSNYFVPDARVGWNRFAIPKAKNIVEKEGVSMIITTGPPHSTHLIGKAIKDQNGIPWIADFRDPWTSIYYEKYLTRSKKSDLKNKRLENDTVQTSDVLLVVSNGMKDEFIDRNINTKVIPNGYDEDDLPEREKKATDIFKLSYIGNLKVNQSIKALWEAILELDQEIEDFKFRLSFTGNVYEGVKSDILKYKIGHLTEYNLFVKHSEAFRLMSVANMLYLPIPQSDNNKLILTGKIFEYIASCSPILSLGPQNGNASELLDICKREKMLTYNDKVSIKEMIKKQYTFWLENAGMSFKHADDSYVQYSRRNITQSLAEIMNGIIEDQKNNKH